MIQSIKNLNRKKKVTLFITFLSITLLAFYFIFLKNRGVTYTLPGEDLSALNGERKISDYLGEEFQWFLYTPDQVPIYVKEVGTGETIVTLHGGFGMSHDYIQQFMKPFEEDFHIVYYDQRGSLRSPVPDYDFEKYITLENMVNDLELLRRELKVDKLKIVAHSMGAVLAYEYMKKFPDKIGDIVIISGFTPKFPETNAGFHDLFTSQKEREAFANRIEVKNSLNNLMNNIDTNSKEYLYLNYKINSSALQFYDINKWNQAVCGISFFNPKMNELIGPESNIPLLFGLKFYLKQKAFEKGTLDTLDRTKFKTPVNYIPVIEQHTGTIDYLLGTHEVGDWNLRLYRRNIKETESIKLHVFENAGHNIWIDKPVEFHEKLKAILTRGSNNSLRKAFSKRSDLE